MILGIVCVNKKSQTTVRVYDCTCTATRYPQAGSLYFKLIY